MIALANIVLGIASFLDVLFGAICIILGAAAFSTPQGKALVPPLYVGGGLTIGCLIFFLGVFGFCAICNKKHYRKFLGVFMVFTTLLFISSGIVMAFIFKYEESMEIASKADLGGTAVAANVATTVRDEAIEMVRTLMENAVYSCWPDVSMTMTPMVYNFACHDIDFDFIGDAVNKCYAAPFNIAPGSPFEVCYEGTPSWPPPYSIVMTELVASSPKGVFCHCSQALMRKIRPFVQYIKYLMIAVVVGFFLVLIACSYLCCAKRVNEEEEKPKKNSKGELDFTAP